MNARSKSTYDIRTESRLNLLVQKLAPVDRLKESMRLDLGSAVGSQSLDGIAIQQSGKEAASMEVHVGGELERILKNLLVHFIGVFVIEWGKTSQHLVQKDAQSPPVNSLGVTLSEKEFRGQVLGSSTEGCTQLAYFTKSTQDDILLVRSSSFMLSLHKPKSHRAM